MSTCCQEVNAILYYDVCEGTPTSFDEVTGRPIFAKTRKAIELSIESSETEPSYKRASGGTDEVEVRIEGRCINPSKLPSEVKPNANYDIEYYFTQDTARRAKIHILPEMRSRFNLDTYFGDKIFGLLVTSPNTKL